MSRDRTGGPDPVRGAAPLRARNSVFRSMPALFPPCIGSLDGLPCNCINYIVVQPFVPASTIRWGRHLRDQSMMFKVVCALCGERYNIVSREEKFQQHALFTRDELLEKVADPKVSIGKLMEFVKGRTITVITLETEDGKHRL